MREKRYLVPLTQRQVDALLLIDRGLEGNLRKDAPLTKALDRIEDECATQRSAPRAELCPTCKIGWVEP